jgi:hypothetical protein
VSRTGVLSRLLAVVMTVVALGCFHPRPEKPKERIHRIRLGYRVSANWYENRVGKDGKPLLVMNLRCTNTGKDTLKVVTLILHIRFFDGSERYSQPLTLDVSKVKPGGQSFSLGEVVVPGLEVREGEQLALQLEDQPTEKEMLTYPEYAGVVTGPARAP